MKKAKPRKPLGRVWCGNLLIADDMLKAYGPRRLRELRDWIDRVLAWAESRGKTK